MNTVDRNLLPHGSGRHDRDEVEPVAARAEGEAGDELIGGLTEPLLLLARDDAVFPVAEQQWNGP